MPKSVEFVPLVQKYDVGIMQLRNTIAINVNLFSSQANLDMGKKKIEAVIECPGDTKSTSASSEIKYLQDSNVLCSHYLEPFIFH